ncbi:MAG: LrgB family protein [Trueperaceae bacterium]|nr:LrgB family protein [Trueperaceae bacterium]
MIALAALLGTVAAYLLAVRIDLAVRRPWTNPVGLSVLAWVGVVAAGVVSLDVYQQGTRPLVWALRPAVVALGWVMYRQRAALARWGLPLVAGVGAGSVVSLLATPLLARALGADAVLQRALALKSVTSAVGVDLAGRLGADAALAVPFIIVTGILGAAFGPPLLRLLGVRRPETLGVALGTNSHGIGTAAVAATGHERAVALSGLAMGLAAVGTALLAPWAFALLGLG